MRNVHIAYNKYSKDEEQKQTSYVRLTSSKDIHVESESHILPDQSKEYFSKSFFIFFRGSYSRANALYSFGEE